MFAFLILVVKTWFFSLIMKRELWNECQDISIAQLYLHGASVHLVIQNAWTPHQLQSCGSDWTLQVDIYIARWHEQYNAQLYPGEVLDWSEDNDLFKERCTSWIPQCKSQYLYHYQMWHAAFVYDKFISSLVWVVKVYFFGITLF